MNAVWNIPYVHRPNFVLRYVRALGVLVLLALSTIGSTVLTGFATLASHGRAATVILLVGSVAVNFVLILAAFMVMTATPLRGARSPWARPWRPLFWQTLQAIGSWYVAPRTGRTTATPTASSRVVIVLLSWIYLGAQLFLLAAEINVVRRYRLWPRSIMQPPLTAADRQVFERLAQMEIRRPEVELAVKFSAEADHDPLDRSSPPDEIPGTGTDAEARPGRDRGLFGPRLQRASGPGRGRRPPSGNGLPTCDRRPARGSSLC